MNLKDKIILVTKSASECKNSLQKLIDEGAELIYFPTIKIIPVYTHENIIELIDNIREFEYIIFTSANAVDIFSEIIEKYNLDLSRTKIAVVGKATAEACRTRGLYIHLIPEEFNARGLIKKFSEIGINNQKILIPGSLLSREELKLGLTELGADVKTLLIYDVVTNDLNELKNEYQIITSKKPDILIFTSPSSFENYIKLVNINDMRNYFNNTVVCAIGPTTEFEIRSYDVNVNIVPEMYTLEGVADAIIKYLNVSKNVS